MLEFEVGIENCLKIYGCHGVISEEKRMGFGLKTLQKFCSIS
jgi:hypothetical protein